MSTPQSTDSPFSSLTFSERGGDLGPPSPQEVKAIPNGAAFVTPHLTSFSGQFGTNARAYSQRFDEAMTYNRENAFRMRHDPLISTCLTVRATPVSLLTWTLEADDPDDQVQADAAKRQEKLLKLMPCFEEWHKWLVEDGLFIGRSGLRTRWAWTAPDANGRQMIYPTAAQPITGDKLGFKWDGTVGIAVSSSFVNAQVEFLDTSPYYFLTREERESVVVHRCYSEDRDFFRPWQAGAINGVGLRDKLYHFWSLKAQIWMMSMDHLRYWARGLTVYYVEHGNQVHADAVADFINKQDGSAAMLYPVFRDPQTNAPYFQKPIERFDASTASPAFMQNLVTGYFDDLIRFTILHQTLTTNTADTGLGSGVAQAHQGTNENRVKLDAVMLQNTYTRDLVGPMYRVNEPGIPPARFVFSIDSPNVQQMLDTAQAIVGMGGSVAAEPLMEAGGLPAVKSNQTILTQVQPQSPTAVGAIPTNDPMMGQDGQQPVAGGPPPGAP